MTLRITLFSTLLMLFFSCNKARRYSVSTLNPIKTKATAIVFSGTSQGDLGDVAERGLCYHLMNVPVYGDNNILTSNNSGDNFTIETKSLTANTSYNVRAFLKLSDGTIIYGKAISVSTNGDYEIGDVGPAGGVIFFINNFSDKKYSEAISTQGSSKIFGCENNYSGTSRFAGDASNNTLLLAQSCGDNSAAGFCNNLTLNGHNDWCLPTIADLSNLFDYYDRQGVFLYFDVFWSSTDEDAIRAMAFDFSSGSEFSDYKSQSHEIIAIRQFN